MNTEVTAVVENKSEAKREESCTESVFVELGQMSEETKGSWAGGYDGGAGKLSDGWAGKLSR